MSYEDVDDYSIDDVYDYLIVDGDLVFLEKLANNLRFANHLYKETDSSFLLKLIEDVKEHENIKNKFITDNADNMFCKFLKNLKLRFYSSQNGNIKSISIYFDYAVIQFEGSCSRNKNKSHKIIIGCRMYDRLNDEYKCHLKKYM